MKLARFKVDCTPAVGVPVCFGTGEKTVGVRDPLWLRGMILDDGNKKCLIASMDYCGLMNSAYDELVSKLSDTTGIPSEFVIIHCIHQHDAPIINFEINEILKIKTFPQKWWHALVAKCAETAKEAFSNMIEITHVGYAKTKIYGYASNRRIIGSDAKCIGMRWSRCNNESLKNKAIGVIDPYIRTIAFFDSTGKIASFMSFYATHPQVSSGRNVFSADAPGEAMKLVENEFKDSFPCFFTGAAGNVTAGKYSSFDDLEGNLLKFGKILADGIIRNLKNLKKEKCKNFHIFSREFKFPRRQIEKVVLKGRFKQDCKQLVNAILQSCEEYAGNIFYRVRLLRISGINLVFMPGEPFVEYQLYAQSLASRKFIATAENCSDNFMYQPLAESFKEGGYEPQQASWCTPLIEKKIKECLRKLILC